ncbi:MAG TPA: hypothetical protein VJH97_06225 [Candidatus Nanoarchaeia archaeon]|nr:hypothetical protein [Candidatus Nanoarchaeia archaeon]
MADIRKIVIIFVVAILFAVLVFAVIDAVYPSPRWENYCVQEKPRAEPLGKVPMNCTTMSVSDADYESCTDQHGYITYAYDAYGCATSYYCETCQYELDQASQRHNLYVFYISALLSLVAIFVGLYLPSKGNTLNEWVGTGFMLGGTFSLFFGTIQSFTSLGRFAKPVVILFELLLIIFMSYKKIGNLREDKKKKH